MWLSSDATKQNGFPCVEIMTLSKHTPHSAFIKLACDGWGLKHVARPLLLKKALLRYETAK